MLSDAKCRNARPQAAAYILADADGLHLRVATTGVKSWRYRRQQDGKEKLITLGRYPTMSLAEARGARDTLRDHGAPRQTESLEAVALRWHARQRPMWKPHHAADVLESLKREVLGELGSKPIADIMTPDIVRVLRIVEDRGAVDLAHRLGQRLSAIYAFAEAEGTATGNPHGKQPDGRASGRGGGTWRDGARALLHARGNANFERS